MKVIKTTQDEITVALNQPDVRWLEHICDLAAGCGDSTEDWVIAEAYTVLFQLAHVSMDKAGLQELHDARWRREHGESPAATAD